MRRTIGLLAVVFIVVIATSVQASLSWQHTISRWQQGNAASQAAGTGRAGAEDPLAWTPPAVSRSGR